MTTSDITNLIERLEAFEDRCEVRLEALWAERYGVWCNGEDAWGVRVLGELHPHDGTNLKHNVQLKLDGYDTAGRVVGTTYEDFSAESFFGFSTFDISLTYRKDTELSKVRLYPVISEY